jgi:hypothetical protein
MHSREQYLATMREEYRRASRKEKKRLLNEARKRTRLNRKVLIRKLAHPPETPPPRKRRRRAAVYGAEIRAPLAKVWEIFDYPCGQRLVPILREQVERLRQQGELRCSGAVAGLLEKISAKTIDRLLARERQVRAVGRPRRAPVHPLLYQRVPVKTPGDWDREQVGNLQADYVLHCGRSSAGEFVHTLSVVDIATGWWEARPQLGRSQAATQASFEAIRKGLPFRVRELHPDNDSGILNDLLWRYCRRARIALSRSRPYQKNDNAWVEQKNWTHVRKVVGYGRYDTDEEREVLRELYRVLVDYKNFFQPVMKLREKVREGGKVRRIYEEAKTPYQRLLAAGVLKGAARRELEARYQGLNPAALRRRIKELQDRLFDLAEGKREEDLRPRRRGAEIDLRRKRPGAAAAAGGRNR